MTAKWLELSLYAMMKRIARMEVMREIVPESSMITNSNVTMVTLLKVINTAMAMGTVLTSQMKCLVTKSNFLMTFIDLSSIFNISQEQNCEIALSWNSYNHYDNRKDHNKGQKTFEVLLLGLYLRIFELILYFFNFSFQVPSQFQMSCTLTCQNPWEIHIVWKNVLFIQYNIA